MSEQRGIFGGKKQELGSGRQRQRTSHNHVRRRKRGGVPPRLFLKRATSRRKNTDKQWNSAVPSPPSGAQKTKGDGRPRQMFPTCRGRPSAVQEASDTKTCPLDELGRTRRFSGASEIKNGDKKKGKNRNKRNTMPYTPTRPKRRPKLRNTRDSAPSVPRKCASHSMAPKVSFVDGAHN